MEVVRNSLPPLSFGAVLEVLEELPSALRTVRRIRRLSQNQAASEIGIASGTIIKVEEGSGEYRTDTLKLILRWLDSQPEHAFSSLNSTVRKL